MLQLEKSFLLPEIFCLLMQKMTKTKQRIWGVDVMSVGSNELKAFAVICHD